MKRVSTKLEVYLIDNVKGTAFLGETEVVEGNGNPVYKKPFKIVKFEDKTKCQLRVVIFDNGSELGDGSCTIQELISAKDTTVKLLMKRTKSSLTASFGTVVVKGKVVERASRCLLQ
jgi:hypothetical protein